MWIYYCKCDNTIIKSGGVTALPRNCHLYIPQKRRDFTKADVCFQAARMSVPQGFCMLYLSRIVWWAHILFCVSLSFTLLVTHSQRGADFNQFSESLPRTIGSCAFKNLLWVDFSVLSISLHAQMFHSSFETDKCGYKPTNQLAIISYRQQ